MPIQSIDVIVTVHVEENIKFFKDQHWGHMLFFEHLLKKNPPFPLTLLVTRDRTHKQCLSCDVDLLRELHSQEIMEIGLHVHPSLSRFTSEKQKKIIVNEWKHFVNVLGIKPKSFSGGHWCVNIDTLNIVKKLGFVIDASIVPGCVVFSTNGTFVRHSHNFFEPYWVSLTRIDCGDLSSGMLEMPVSIDNNSRIQDIAARELWEIKAHIINLANNRKPNNYMHMTFHSYDLFHSSGRRNYLCDKMMIIMDLLLGYFDRVNATTCYNYFKKKVKEDGL